MAAPVLAASSVSWVTPQALVSEDGYATLRWTVSGSELVDLFRVTEIHNNSRQVSFTDQAEIRIFRIEPGSYTFKVQACEQSADGFPQCGKSSAKLELRVTDAVDEIQVEKRAFSRSSADNGISRSVAGGPDKLKPGLWHNPQRQGHGWSFHWSNRLALPESNSQHGNVYDLIATWYTYEAKLRYKDGPPPCGEGAGGVGCYWVYENYLPTAVKLKMVETAANQFTGGLTITWNGIEYPQQGSAVISFANNNTTAHISWDASFKWQSLTGHDDLQLLAGGASGLDNASQYSGLWVPQNNTVFQISDHIGSDSEVIELSFPDTSGDLSWMQAAYNSAPTASDTPLCFYYIQQGYSPADQGTPWFHQDGCDPDLPPGKTNSNASRSFSNFETGAFWLRYQLPGVTGPVTLQLGSQSYPLALTKIAGLHRIYWSHVAGDSCTINSMSPQCSLKLTWFTDGDYPGATAYAINLDTGQRSFVSGSPEPAMPDVSFNLQDAGRYRFELRMSQSSSAPLIAQSSIFTVLEQGLSTPISFSASWVDREAGSFQLRWMHPATQEVGWYEIEEHRPQQPLIQIYQISPGTSLEKAFFYPAGPLGTYSYRIRACVGTTAGALCSNWSEFLDWYLGEEGEVAHPWADHAYGDLILNANYHYAMGYHFAPDLDGTITELGGLFKGVKTVKLFAFNSGELLAQASVDSNNDWVFVPISPVSVSAGEQYTVAVYLAGAGASYHRYVNLPINFDGLNILGTTYISTSSDASARPINTLTSTMYGQVDVGFVAGSVNPTVNQAPEFNQPLQDQLSIEGAVVDLQFSASDPDGDTLSWSDHQSLPPGLSLSSGGRVQGTLSSQAALGSPYLVNIEISDGQAGHETSASFIWTIQTIPSGQSHSLFTDDFETDKGWSVNWRGLDTARRGQWERGDAETTGSGGKDYQLDAAVSGVFSLVTGAAAGAKLGSNDVDRGVTSIASPLIDLPAGVSGLKLRFHYNFAYKSSTSSLDSFQVNLLAGDSVSTVYTEVDDDSGAHPGAWQEVELDLSSFAGKTIRIEFQAADDAASGATVEAQVDDVSISYNITTSNTAPTILQPADQTYASGSQISPVQIEVQDAENDPVSCDFSNLPSGLIESSECRVSGTISAAAGMYTSQVSANDGELSSPEVSIKWTVISAAPTSSPETPPDPAAQPDMAPDASSSRVGTTAGSFSVGPSGNATYSIPLLTAPASGGFAPQMSIDWSSQGGNGHLGVGGSLGGLSNISRCSQTREQDGIDHQVGITLGSDDRFCLDGQRLMAVAGAYGAHGTEYRRELDNFDKVVSLGSVGKGPASFTVWHKNGTVSQYGATDDSRIEGRSSGDDQTASVWALNRQTDSSGNYIDYQYAEFYGSSGSPVEYLLSSVQYTGNSNAGTFPYAQLDFVYDDTRSDLAITALAGGLQVLGRLLVRVDSRARKAATSNLEFLRSWHLGYGTDGHGRRALLAVQECNNEQKTYCFPATQFGWQFSSNDINSSGTKVGEVFSKQHAGLALADITGDGRVDLVLTEQSGDDFKFRISTASKNGGFEAPGSVGYPIPGTGLENQPVQLLAIDLNADGYDDLVYPSESGWRARLSNGKTVENEISITGTCCGLTKPAMARVMDFDGDGLADLVTNRLLSDGGMELVLLRNRYSALSPQNLGFEPARVLTVNLQTGLFPAQTSDGWWIDTEAPHFGTPNSTSSPFSRPFDYNGDGAVDLLVRLSQRYIKCTSSCAARSVGRDSAQQASFTHFVFDDSPPAERTQSGDETYAWASFYVVLEADGETAFSQSTMIARGEDCLVSEACEPFSALPKVKRIQAADVNADGLADVVYQDSYSFWLAQINTGKGLFPSAIPITQISDGGLSSRALLLDITGDGYPDFIHPDKTSEDNARWVIHENQFGMAFGEGQNSAYLYGNSEHDDLSILADFNADGFIDNLLINFGLSGQIETATTRLFLGKNKPAYAGDQAINQMVSITQGHGTQIQLDYLPLTDGTVYTRMHNASLARWGRNSQVFDILAPIQVVSEVQRSAPLYQNADALGTIQYHYVGARLQAGGRGFLGFNEVIQYEFSTGIRRNTRYRQDFPFIGMEADITHVLADSAQAFDPIGNPDSIIIASWPGVDASTTAPSLNAGLSVLDYTVHQSGLINSTSNPKIFAPVPVVSLQRFYTLDGQLQHKVLASSEFDSFGNITSLITETYEKDNNSAFASMISNSSFINDQVNWRLGQETYRSVSRSRSGLESVTNELSMSYDSGSGLLRQEISEPNRTSVRVTTTYQHDQFGNRIRSTVTGIGMDPRNRFWQFDSLGRFVIETQNAYQQTTLKITQWDAFGNALVSEDLNGTSTINAVDYMGRPFASWTETGAAKEFARKGGAGPHCSVADTSFYLVETGTGTPTQYRCFDRLGREIRLASQGFNGVYIHIDRFYDEQGRAERVSEPYFAGQSRYWNRTAYDAVGRVDSVLAADGNDQIIEYDLAAAGCVSGNVGQTLTSNGLGQERLEQHNALGETTTVYDHYCGRTDYDYDATGNLVRVTGAEGTTTITSFDVLGRKISLDDPDKGLWQYAYNALGELTRQLDPKGQAIDMEYDQLGRLTVRWERSDVNNIADGNFQTINSETNIWNTNAGQGSTGPGQLEQQVYRNGTNGMVLHERTYTYDEFGRVSKVSNLLDGMQFSEWTTYDEFGRIFQQFDASGNDNGIRYHYSNGGFIEKLQEARQGKKGKVYQAIRAMDARGNVTQTDLANGLQLFANHSAQSGRIDLLEAYGAGGEELQFIEYQFDVAGNLLSRHDLSQQSNFLEQFNYDGLNRLEEVLLSVNRGAMQTTSSFQYSPAGNMLFKSDVGTYSYGESSSGPHAVSRAGQISYNYDANGNQTSSSDGRQISYSVFDQVVSIIRGDQTIDFLYGIGNARVKRIDDNPVDGQKVSWYLGQVERIEKTNHVVMFKRYIGGIAVADYYPDSDIQIDSYLVRDHLGSPHSITTESGAVSESMPFSFSAFGERRNAQWIESPGFSDLIAINAVTTKGFTGHEHMDSLGVIHMNGRIYDPKLGRFLQADPFVQNPKNSQSLNRYSYVMNNPLSYTDPSGFFSISKFWKKIRPVVGIAIAVYMPGALTALGGIWATSAGASSIAAVTASGFTAGYVVSGNLKGAVIGAFSAAAFYGIGTTFRQYGGAGSWGELKLSGHAFSEKSIFHGLVGGVSSAAGGGRFAHGFIASGVTQAFSGQIGKINKSYGRVAAAAVLGGSASSVSGGNFVSGAVLGGFSRAFNDEIHIEGTFRAPSLLRHAINEIYDTDFDGQGGSMGLAISFPGAFGGEFDLGGYVQGNAGGQDIGTGRFSVGVGYGVEHVRGMTGSGSEYSFNDGIGGLSAEFDHQNNLSSIGMHFGVGFNGGGSGIVTNSWSIRNGWENLKSWWNK